MQTVQKILFPTDFSPCAQNAFRYALTFAEKTGAKIMVLHIVLPEYEALDLPVMAMQATREKIESAREVMKDFVDYGLTQLQTVGKLNKVPAIETEVELGGISDVISTYVRRDDYDLVIMGTRSDHDTFDRIFGSTATSVIAHAASHVLIVPEDAEPTRINTVVYASDLHETDPYHIWEAAKLLDPFNPIIRCVHIHSEDEERTLDMSQLQAFFNNHAPTLQITFTEIESDDVTESLNEFIDTFNADLVVMSSPHRSMIERLFHRSMTRKMSLHASTPLLVVREK